MKRPLWPWERAKRAITLFPWQETAARYLTERFEIAGWRVGALTKVIDARVPTATRLDPDEAVQPTRPVAVAT